MNSLALNNLGLQSLSALETLTKALKEKDEALRQTLSYSEECSRIIEQAFEPMRRFQEQIEAMCRPLKELQDNLALLGKSYQFASSATVKVIEEIDSSSELVEVEIAPQVAINTEEIEERIAKKVLAKLRPITTAISLEGSSIDTHKFPIMLKPSTNWADLTIEFINGCDVQIRVNGIEESLNTNCRRMGFEKKTDGAPRKCWKMLEALSHFDGNSVWDNGLPTVFTKKRKQEIKRLLSEYFGITGDPFYPYSKKYGYRLKIKLIPEAT